MAGEYFQAGFGGAATGAGAGFAVGGPVGAGIGAGIGLIGGLMQAGNARKKMADYQKAQNAVQPVDPNQVAFLNKLNRQEQFYRAGTDAASGFAMQNQNNALAQTQVNLTRAGAPGNQLLRAQQVANMGQAAVGAAAAQRADNLLPMQGNMTNLIAQRVYENQQRNRDMALARSEQAQQDINNMFAGGMAVLPQMAGSFKAGQGGGGKPMNNMKNANFNPQFSAANAQQMFAKQIGPVSQGGQQGPMWWSGPQPPAWWTPQ